MRHYLPFEKVEDNGDGTITVTGIASSESVDNAGEIIRANAIKNALPDFFRLGTGALREMHGLSAAGTVDDAAVDDATNKTEIVATVVDPIAIKKVKKGVYKGFSVGGKVTARDDTDRKVITGVKLAEISLVDSPCNPDAIFDMWKADGIDLNDEVPLEDPDDDQVNKADGDEPSEDESDTDLDKPIVLKHASGTEIHIDGDGAVEIHKRDFNTKERKKDAKSGAAMPDGSFPIENKQDLRNAVRAFGRAKNKAAAKRHIIARARALGATDLLPDDWNVSAKKADGAQPNGDDMTVASKEAVGPGASDDTKKAADTAQQDDAKQAPAAKPNDGADQATKANDAAKGSTADPIAPTTVGDVLQDGDNSTAAPNTPGAPVAGAQVMANFPPGDGKGQHTSTVANQATTGTGNAGQDSLNPSDTPVVQHQTADAATDGTDVRSDKRSADSAEPLTAAERAAAVLKAASGAVDKLVRRANGAADVRAPLAKGAELRKDMSDVGCLGYLLCELSYLLTKSTFEADMEGDNSPVPEMLRDAIKNLAGVYKAMSDEEISELLNSTEKAIGAKLVLAASEGDLTKAFEGAGDLDKVLSGSAMEKAVALEAENADLRKATEDLTVGLEALTKRVEELASEPLPPKTVTKAVDPVPVSKEQDTAGLDKAAAASAPAQKLSDEDVRKALEGMSDEERSLVLIKAAHSFPIPINR